MKETKYTVKYTTSFKKDYKRAIKRGLKIELLEQVVALLAMGEPLPDKNRDHDLSGDWAGHRECHILPDWLLVYGQHVQYFLFLRHRFASSQYPFIYSSNFRMFFPIFF